MEGGVQAAGSPLALNPCASTGPYSPCPTQPPSPLRHPPTLMLFRPSAYSALTLACQRAGHCSWRRRPAASLSTCTAAAHSRGRRQGPLEVPCAGQSVAVPTAVQPAGMRAQGSVLPLFPGPPIPPTWARRQYRACQAPLRCSASHCPAAPEAQCARQRGSQSSGARPASCHVRHTHTARPRSGAWSWAKTVCSTSWGRVSTVVQPPSSSIGSGPVGGGAAAGVAPIGAGWGPKQSCRRPIALPN